MNNVGTSIRRISARKSASIMDRLQANTTGTEHCI
jgi:hypothetical protein